MSSANSIVHTAPQMSDPIRTAATKFAHTPELLLCFADNAPKNKSLLFNLCLVSRTFYHIFKPLLWRDMCQGDFYAKEECFNSSSDTDNLRYMKTYDDGMDGIHTYKEFNTYGVFSQTPNLELAAFEPAYEELLETIQEECPKIRGLYLEVCEHRPEIPPSLFDQFSNLTHLVIDSLTIQEGHWTWRDQAASLADVLIRSPQMRTFGLRLKLHVDKLYFFVLVSNEFARINADGTKRLRLKTLLLDRTEFPPPCPGDVSDDPGRYIQQLTEVRFLEHLHLGGAGLRQAAYDDTLFDHALLGNDLWADGAYEHENMPMVVLPSFISSKSTPNLRLLSTHTINPYVNDWLYRINSNDPELASQMSFSCRPANDHWRLDQRQPGRGLPGTLDELFSSFAKKPSENKSDPTDRKGNTSYNFRSVVLSLTWSHLPSRNAELYVEEQAQYRDVLAQIQVSPNDDNNKNTRRDTLREIAIHLKNLDSHVPYPLPESHEQLPPDLLTDPTSSDAAEYLANISMTRCDFTDWEEQRRSFLAYGNHPPEYHWRGTAGCISSPTALEMVRQTILSLFHGLRATSIRALYIPLDIPVHDSRIVFANKKNQEKHLKKMKMEIVEDWNNKLILDLAKEENLPALRYVKIQGPAYEIVRRSDGGVDRLLKLGRLEEIEIELFRNVWEPGWWA